MPKIKIICSKCGGENVLRDAYASWDVDAQEWALSSVYDTFRCDDCGHDACDEVPVDDEPETPEQLARAEGWEVDETAPSTEQIWKRDHGETFTASSWAEACKLEGIDL